MGFSSNLRGGVLLIGRGGLGSALIRSAPTEVESLDLPEIDLAVRGSVSRVLCAKSPSLVIHTAAITDVEFCEANQELAFSVNGEGTREVADACKDIEARLIYISTDSVFGANGEGPFLETDIPLPINAYAHSKRIGEEYSLKIPNSLVVRLPWLIGAGRPNFVDACIESLLKNEKFPAYTDYTGYILTYGLAAEIIWELARDEKAGGIFHAHKPPYLSRFEQARIIAEAIGEDKVELIIPASVKDARWRVPRPTFMNMANSNLNHPAMKLLPSTETVLREYCQRSLADKE